jgi:tRNASer (uridine44-2'-O)-methyltransferase
MVNSSQASSVDESPSLTLFSPRNLLDGPAQFNLPNESEWKSILETRCSFSPEYFLQVMDNLLRNPNITSSCLFRAEIYYDSIQDISVFEDPSQAYARSTLLRQIKAELQPKRLDAHPGLRIRRTVVRNLVPRNPQLDKPLVQTVQFLDGDGPDGEVKNVVIQIPHTQDPESIPFYHPKVQGLAIQHNYNSTSKRGSLSIHYRLFPSYEMTDRLQRTALNVLRIVHKHSTGRQKGYQKRVHHDQIISQKRFQDTYSRLKAKHAKWLMDAWAEVTDPLKHVFEDLGIAAFLIELWKDMYGSKIPFRRKFPSFVDIGCGNGVLVYILLMEGYTGWGFDARRRKSWSIFPENVQAKLKEMILIPDILLYSYTSEHPDSFSNSTINTDEGYHNGIFPSGTFIISNHADQLTPWTPLLAYASQSPFIAIPCCSHSLSGKVTRFYDAPPASRSSTSSASSTKSAEIASPNASVSLDAQGKDPQLTSPEPESQTPQEPQHEKENQQPSHGTLSKPAATPSAYAGFTAHIMHLASSAGFASVEHEVLRIPSTRNLCVVGRAPREENDADKRREDVREVAQDEVGNVLAAAEDWVRGAEALRRPGARGAFGGH